MVDLWVLGGHGVCLWVLGGHGVRLWVLGGCGVCLVEGGCEGRGARERDVREWRLRWWLIVVVWVISFTSILNFAITVILVW